MEGRSRSDKMQKAREEIRDSSAAHRIQVGEQGAGQQGVDSRGWIMGGWEGAPVTSGCTAQNGQRAVGVVLLSYHACLIMLKLLRVPMASSGLA